MYIQEINIRSSPSASKIFNKLACKPSGLSILKRLLSPHKTILVSEGVSMSKVLLHQSSVCIGCKETHQMPGGTILAGLTFLMLTQHRWTSLLLNQSRNRKRCSLILSTYNNFFWSSIVLVVLFFNWPFSSMRGGEMRDHRGNGVSTISLFLSFRIRLLVLRVCLNLLLSFGCEFPFHVTCEWKNWYPLPRPYLEGKNRSSAFYSELAMWIIHWV